jgi:hypothetical protein
MNERIYGNDPTSLKLSRVARKVYQQTDPLIIIEYDELDGSIRYSMDGCIKKFDLTAEEVNEILEDLA